MSAGQLNRRQAIIAIGAGIAGAPAILRGRYQVFAQSQAQYSARCVKLMEEHMVVDLLNQFRFPDFAEQPPRITRWLAQAGSLSAEDAAIYRGSGLTALALGHGADSYEAGLKFFAEWNGLLAQYSDWFLRIDDGGDFTRAKAAKKLGVMLTFQNSEHFRTPNDVDTFFGLGQRLSQLTYNFNNGIGSGFLEHRDGGLSVFGGSIVERMNAVGMAVDVSHCGDQTTLDALATSRQPVVFSHANCRALAPSLMRCKTDEAIRAMARSGGVMGIAFIRFLVREQEPVTIEHVIDHVDHVAKLVGIQHVAIGSDLDMVGNPNPIGGGRNPRTQPNFSRYSYHEDSDGAITIKGVNHPRRMFDVTEALIRRGYQDADIGLILGGNAVRVLSGIWSSPVKTTRSG
ncbi:MAG: dipeptidase [Gemmatimonadaceae bacterium]